MNFRWNKKSMEKEPTKKAANPKQAATILKI